MLRLEFSRFHMLRFLRIKHLAVIDSVEVEFDPGLNVLTGETGAGKSILVEAVGLLLGGRASGDLVRTGEDAAAIEAIFESGGRRAPGPPRNHRAGPQPRLRQRRAGHGRRAEGSVVAADRAARPARASDAARSRRHTSACSTRSARSSRWRRRRRGRVRRDARGARTSSLASSARPRDASARRTSSPSSSASSSRPRSSAGRRRRAGARSPVLASAERVERLCAESYASLYESDDAVLAALGGVWRRVGGAGALDPQFQPYLERATASSRSSRTSRCSSAAMPTASKRRRRGCSRSRSGSRCSSV